MPFPSNIQTGTVVGRLLSPTVDGPLPGADKTAVPSDVVVEFVPSLLRIPAPAATPGPVTFLAGTSNRPVMGVIDSEGYLSTPDPENSEIPQFRGVRLVASDSGGMSVVGWEWVATVRLKAGRVLFALRFTVPANGEVDLTNATPALAGPDAAALIWYGDTEPPAAGNYTIWVQPDGTWLTLEAS